MNKFAAYLLDTYKPLSNISPCRDNVNKFAYNPYKISVPVKKWVIYLAKSTNVFRKKTRLRYLPMYRKPQGTDSQNMVPIILSFLNHAISLAVQEEKNER